MAGGGVAVTLAAVLAAAPGAGAVQVPPGAKTVSGPYGLQLLKPPNSMTCDEQRVVVGVVRRQRHSAPGSTRSGRGRVVLSRAAGVACRNDHGTSL
jgi:hypothetical protein